MGMRLVSTVLKASSRTDIGRRFDSAHLHDGGVAQWQSRGLLIPWPKVRVLLPPRGELTWPLTSATVDEAKRVRQSPVWLDTGALGSWKS